MCAVSGQGVPSVSKTLYLEPRDPIPLPLIVSHREWCLWLSARGSLKPEHRACVSADRCVAAGGRVHAVGSWEGRG